jgi:hypothetical protein
VEPRDDLVTVGELDVLRAMPRDVRRVDLELQEEDRRVPGRDVAEVEGEAAIVAALGDGREGSTVFMLIPSPQPGSSLRIACFRSRLAVMWKRASMKSPPRMAVGA